MSDERPRIISGYGIGSAVLGVIAVAAIVFVTMIWSTHRDAVQDRDYQSRVMQAAVQWSGLLINMNADNVDINVEKLHDGTVGELNADFEDSIKPYTDVIKTLQSRTTGQIESVSVEAVHHDLPPVPGQRPPPPKLPAELAQRTDSVLVVATSVSRNRENKPTTVHWNLRLGVSDVNGKLMISRLESLK